MGKRLLLIDDEISDDPGKPNTGGYMWYYSQALRDQGYELKEVNSTDQAFEVLGGQPFDLILLDVMMPPGKSLTDADTASGVRTGLVLADRLAQANPQMPILILTNVENPGTLQALRSKPNVKRVLQKTDFPPFALVDEVKQILGEVT